MSSKEKNEPLESSVDLAALAVWLREQNLGEGEITQHKVLTGGTQNILLRFEFGGRAMVLRRPPPVPRPGNNKTMMREARVLGALANYDIPHPRLIASCDDEAVMGVCFYVMEEIIGFNAANGMPELHAGSAEIRREMGFSYVDAAAALGKVDYLEAGLEGFGKPENYLQRQVSRWQQQLDSYESFANWPGAASIPFVNEAAEYLSANCPDSFKPGIIHGDYGLANVMFSNDSAEVAAMIDWELSTIGDPLLDLGWILSLWRGSGGPDLNILTIEPWDGFPSGDELIERYAAQTDRDMSNLVWYIVLACYKLGIILEGTHARACEGKAPKETGDMLHAATLGLFERAGYWIKQ